MMQRYDAEIWLAVLSCHVLGAHIKVSAYGYGRGIVAPHQFFWDTLSISESIRARKLKFGTLVGIYAY